MIRTALSNVEKAYEGYKKTKEKMLSDLDKKTERLAPKYRREEAEKCKESISSMRVNFKRTMQTILDDAEKAVGSTIPTPLSNEQLRELESNRYYQYSPEEWATMAQKSLKAKDLTYLRAIRNTAAASGIELKNLPMSDHEGLEGLKQVVQIATKLSDDNIPDRLSWEEKMEYLIEKTSNGLSMFDESGGLKNITASYTSEDPFLNGFNKGMGNGAGGGVNG